MNGTQLVAKIEVNPGKTVTNFGGNVKFTPRHYYVPRDEGEVLAILNNHSTGKVRVVGSLHAWSDLILSEDVLVDMRYINQVEITREEDGQVWVTVGGGCPIQRVLDVIHQQTDSTLPTMGGIKKQTISGAISTGTHGSGRPSLSHYMEELRIAAYDPETKEARIYEWTEGVERSAARCSLGCMGIILSVKFRCIPKYNVAEAIVHRESLAEVLADETGSPLQQFILVPYCWKYFVYRRSIVDVKLQGMKKVFAYQKRAYAILGVDISLHLNLKLIILVASSKQGDSKFIRRFYRALVPRFIGRRRSVVDFSEHAITLRHDIFTHLEMELFVSASNIEKALRLIRYIVTAFSDPSHVIPEDVAVDLDRIGQLDALNENRGNYTHHYPIYCRRVLPDDTLISMTGGSSEPYYSISFFTFLPPDSRDRFYTLVKYVAICLNRLCGAKPHWGKYFPLAHDDIKGVYPQLEVFRQICHRVDPNGVFRNQYTDQVLGFAD